MPTIKFAGESRHLRCITSCNPLCSASAQFGKNSGLALWHLRPCALGCRDAYYVGHSESVHVRCTDFQSHLIFCISLEGSVPKRLARKHQGQKVLSCNVRVKQLPQQSGFRSKSF
jgi:hypothetical protein